MKQEGKASLSRREFLVMTAGAGAGLTLGMVLPGCSREAPVQPQAGPGKAAGKVMAPTRFEPNAFVRIGTDNRVTVIIKHLEMGQGTYTGLATLVAEELDAAWSQIDVEGAPADANTYNNLLWGKVQGTGGSTAIANSYEQMRKAGAAAREMLVAAAAKKWNVAASDITVQDGVLRHPSGGHQAAFGELAELAAQEAVPEEVFLKDPEEFRLIGTRVPRKDSKAKTNGTALFTQDVKLPGMLTALVAHPPRFGATVKSLDAGKAKAIAGVDAVVEIPNGVAVLGKDFWSAKKGRDALQIEWDESSAFKLGSDELFAQYNALSEKPGSVARNDGDVQNAMQSASKTLQATMEFPFLAHAALEPMNCVMQRHKDGVEIWNGEQFQTPDQAAVAGVFGIAPEQVKINMLYAGGSFGRRANPQSDYVVETATAPVITGRCMFTNSKPAWMQTANRWPGNIASSANPSSPAPGLKAG
jgi:isoquinoline 1-oxidoreductase beta subunit